MAMIEIHNVSNVHVILADHQGYYGGIKPKTMIVLPETILEKACVAGPIRSGLLQVRRGSKVFSRVEATKGVATRPQSGIATRDGVTMAHANTSEFDLSPEEATTAFGGDALDAVSVQGPLAKKSAVKTTTPPGLPAGMTDLGKRLIRAGKHGRKKLVPVAKPTERIKAGHVTELDHGMTHRPNDGNGNARNVVKTKGTNSITQAQSGEDMGMIIVPSAIPGGAEEVPVNESTWDRLTRASNQTKQVLGGLANERRIDAFRSMDEAAQITYVKSLEHPGMLKQLADQNWKGGVAKAIRSRIKVLTG